MDNQFKTNLVKTYEVFHLNDQASLARLTYEQAAASIDKFASQDTYFELSPLQLANLKTVSEKIFRLTNETLLDLIKQKKFEPWMEERYGVVKSLWNDSQEGINLMRIDYAWDQAGNLQVLELNTAAHSGWLKSGLTEKRAAAEQFGTSLAPELTFFAKYLLEKLGSRIAIMVIRKDYQTHYPQLNWVATQLEKLGGKCQIFYLSEANLPEISNFQPTGLFWKSHSILVEHAELVLKVAKLGLPQLPSFASLFITGDKSFLANLKNKDTTGAIPPTYVLSKSDLNKNFSFLAKDYAVLKPGDLASGRGIKFGKYFTEEAWQAEIQATTDSPEEWVLQELCYLKKSKDGRYQDLTVFLADGLARGVASRISTDEVVNVGQGGLYQAVVLRDNSFLN